MDNYDALIAYLAKETAEEAREAQMALELHERPLPAPERVAEPPVVNYVLDDCVPF